jgi:hypothetical protein
MDLAVPLLASVPAITKKTLVSTNGRWLLPTGQLWTQWKHAKKATELGENVSQKSDCLAPVSVPMAPVGNKSSQRFACREPRVFFCPTTEAKLSTLRPFRHYPRHHDGQRQRVAVQGHGVSSGATASTSS